MLSGPSLLINSLAQSIYLFIVGWTITYIGIYTASRGTLDVSPVFL